MAAPWFYRVAWGGALALTSPYLLGRSLARPGEMRERLGRWPPLPESATRGIWVHAASVGEARAARALLRALADRQLPLLLSVVTPAARSLEAELMAAGAAAVRHAPLDFAPFVRRALSAARPRAILFVETEIWPELLAQALRGGIPTGFVSARLTPASGRRLARARPLLGAGLGRVHVGAQSAADAGRWRLLGIPDGQVRVTGNLKYERPRGPLPRSEREAARRGWRQVLVFGSVRGGEIAAIARALQGCRDLPGPTLVVLAPRHPQRTLARLRRAIGAEWRVHERWNRDPLLVPPALPLDSGAPAAGLADAGPAPLSAASSPEHAVLLLGTVGELRDFYAVADAAFVGGTLNLVGGHNLFEAAELGVPVLFGPHTGNVEDVAAALLETGGGRRVADGEDLARAIRDWLADPASLAAASRGALQAAERLGGALGRTLEALHDWGFPLDGPRPHSEAVP